MASGFLLVLLGCLVLPPLASRLLGLGRWLPLVFVQLLLGMLLTASGALDTLRGLGVDLQHGPLASSLQGLGWLGVCLLIALGAHAGGAPTPADPAGRWRFVPVSVGGFVFSAAVGAALGWWLGGVQPGLMGPNAGRATFAAALGLLLAVTALPVLLAILTQLDLADTPMGRLAARCASLDDLWLWLAIGAVLAFGVPQSAAAPGTTLAAAVALGAVFTLLRRPLARTFARPLDGGTRLLTSLALILACAAATQAAGLHAVLGAFAGGALLPPAAVAAWREPVLRFAQALLLPFFFVHSGMSVHIDAADPRFWALTALLTAAAVAAKFGSVALLGRASGLAWREAGALGALMQCKGLMELVAVGVLHEAGLIDARIASALAAMALLSTVLTAPLVRLCLARRAPVPTPVPALQVTAVR